MMLLSLLFLLAVVVPRRHARSCAAEQEMGPYYVSAGTDQIYRLSYVQNITVLSISAEDEYFHTPSNFTVQIRDSAGKKYLYGSDSGCFDNGNTTWMALIAPVFFDFNCTNHYFTCVLSFTIDFDECLPVCRGEDCVDDGCGKTCEICQYPCGNGDYCEYRPETNSASQSQSAVKLTRSHSFSRVGSSDNHTLDTDDDPNAESSSNTLNAGQTGALVIGVLAVGALAGVFFMYRKHPQHRIFQLKTWH